jgi:chaperonin GroEL (HSP60 family)
VGGREQLAIEAFAKALEGIPRALAENAGLDAIDILIELKAAHEKGQRSAGVDVINGRIADMRELKVIEPLRVKKNAIQSATEVANMVLRIDDVIAARPMKEEKGKGGGGPGMGGMPPGMM